MAKKMVKVLDCDRCPRNRKPNAATITVPFSFGDEHWLIDLCEECHSRMEREMFAWGRLGREDESQTRVQRFTKDSVAEGRRLAELRTRQAETVSAPASSKPMHLSGPIPDGLPEEAKDWVFDPHAIQRMRERHVSALEVLRAACKPEVYAPSDRREFGDRMVHRAGGVKVVVDPIQQVIYTVAREDVPETPRKAV